MDIEQHVEELKAGALEVLLAARKRITPIKNWTQGSTARSRDGREVVGTRLRPVSFCAVGAIRFVDDSKPLPFFAERLLATVSREAMGLDIVGLNDTLVDTAEELAHVHASVLDAYDVTIQMLSKAISAERLSEIEDFSAHTTARWLRVLRERRVWAAERVVVVEKPYWADDFATLDDLASYSTISVLMKDWSK